MTDAAIETLYPREKPSSASLRRIRRLALPFEIAFGCLAGIVTLFFVTLITMALMPGGYVTFNAEGGWLTFDPATAPSDAKPLAAFSPALQVAGFVTVSLIYGGLIQALWALYRLFSCYRQGMVFAPEPIRLMRRAGLGLVVFAAVPGLAQPLLRRLGSPDQNWFHGETIPILIMGAALFLFAHIMALGIELERETKEFV